MACGARYPVVMSMGSASSHLRQVAHTGLQGMEGQPGIMQTDASQSTRLEKMMPCAMHAAVRGGHEEEA